jgi:20S proteasome subunit beta 6
MLMLASFIRSDNMNIMSSKPMPMPMPGLFSTSSLGQTVESAESVASSSSAAGREFDPYADNGGNILAISGENFVVIASDLRLSEGYSILSRNITRLFSLSEDDDAAEGDGLLFGGCGCYADILELSKQLRYHATLYHRLNKRKLSPQAAAYLLSSMLYGRRFFPYYSFSCIAGIDPTGYGAVYEYDAVGSFQRCRTACHGSAQKLLRPFLDEIDSKQDTALWKLNPSK